MAAGKAKRCSGFTLIELLVTVAVIIVTATIAVPGFRGLVEQNRLSSDFNKILSSMNYARNEAVKRRDNVVVKVSGAWQVQVQVGEGEDLIILREFSSSGDRVSISPDPFEITFNALGRSPGCTSVSPCELSVVYNSSEVLSVNAAGNISRP